MKRIGDRFLFAAIVGLAMVLPFMTLELATATDAPRSRFGFPMFGIMWLLAAVFVLMLMPIVRSLRAGTMAIASPASLVLRVAVAGLIAWSWVALVIDQWPCFLGATGC
ncbi:MAG: hypothetical protein WD627_11805 [Actinomycetota bacterium]